MTNKEIYALEMNLIERISKKKFSWSKLVDLFTLSAIAENN